MQLAWILCAFGLLAAERQVDPTFLRRHLPDVKETTADVTTATCRYKAAFGAGDEQARVLRGVARFGEIIVDAGGSCTALDSPAEEQAYVVLEGSPALTYAGERHSLRADDFLYLAAGVKRALSNPSAARARVLVMGYRVPAGAAPSSPKLQIANFNDVPAQVVGGHPPSTLYRLLIGDTKSTRDRIAAGQVLTSLFIMEFAPGGTNFPHHHEREEEIYLLLKGSGEMVAGSGADGVEGRFSARPGDAYFFRLNCTVGFYNGPQPGRILAVRSLFPFGRR